MRSSNGATRPGYGPGMSTKSRIALTAALGLLAGVSTWMTDWSSTANTVNALAFVAAILVPLIVGRWWVVIAIAGQLIALVALQLTGQSIQGLDNTEMPALSPLGIIGLVASGIYLLILVGIRKAFDRWRNRRVIANA
jgi:hypothetical protein